MCCPKFLFKHDHARGGGSLRVLFPQDRDRAVGAPVIDEDDLVRLSQGVENRIQAGEERRKDRFLVVDGDDDRERRSHRPYGTLPFRDACRPSHPRRRAALRALSSSV